MGVGEAAGLTATEARAVAMWLADNGFGWGEVEKLCAVGGGTQNIMARFDYAGESYILRRGPRHLRPRSNDTILRECRVLRALDGADVPHPRLIATCEDASVLDGAVFYLMEPVDGFNPSVELPPLHAGSEAVRHAMCLHLVDALAALGAVDHRAVGLDGFGKPEGFLERQVPRWLSELDGYRRYEGYPGVAIPGVDGVAKWLDQNRPRAWRPGLMHGDFHFANAMFKPDSAEVAAVVDWEMCTIGDPLLDLGWLLATWQLPAVPGMFGAGLMGTTGLATAHELADRYARASDRDLNSLSWYVVLACFKLGIVLEGTHARACAGQADKRIGDELHRTTLLLFERANDIIKGDK
ncbi:phosphotransferase family protein [Nocardia sp. NPDC005366]|uniref:phosphotransferase family protein n=1 Tax=Nocardia sp. NPDC005366 TaxID=3156878 RepID=UPI0033B8C851